MGADASMKIIVKEERHLGDFLVDKLGASGTKVRKLIKHGGVSVNGQLAARPDFPLKPGQTLEISRPTLPPPFPILLESTEFLTIKIA